jgi:DNA-binding transcriptional LysR family regulator
MLAVKFPPGAVVELRHLRYLVAVADAGTFVRAAEQLRVAQPALSRQINDLERELAVELFAAGARKATLTPAGDACVRIARHVIRDTELAVARARLSNSGLAGRCVVSSGPAPVAAGFVSRLAERVKRHYPGILLELAEASQHEQWDALVEGRADIALGVPAPTAEYPSLAAETQYVSPISMALLAPNHPLTGRSEVSLAELAAFDLMMLDVQDGDGLRARILQELKRAKYPGRLVDAHGFEALIGRISASHAWAPMPDSLATRFPPLAGVRITDFVVPIRTVRMWRRADRRPLLRTVLNELRQMELEERDQAVAAVHARPAETFVPARLELRHLRSFASVARYGSLGRAAEALEITQPALSRQMRDLEYDVSVKLMERGTRGMELTAAGQGFLSDVKNLLSVADHLRKEVRRAERGSTGRCEIGVAPHPVALRILGAAMQQLSTTHPSLAVHTRQVPSPQQATALRKSELDVVVGLCFPVPPAASDGLARHRLVDDSLCAALLSTRHPLASAPELSLADLRDVPFLFGGRPFFPRFYDTVMQAFRQAHVEPRIENTYDRLPTTWSIAALGEGWTLGWRSHLDEPPAGLRAVLLRDFHLPWGAELVYRQDESRPVILAVIDAIEAASRAASGAVTASIARLPSTHASGAVIS